MMAGYRDLIVWQKSMDLVVAVYQISSLLPKTETYGLVSQIRRAAISIPSNIAEGRGRESNGDYCRFLSIAYGSLCDVETQFEIAVRLGFVQQETIVQILSNCSEVARLLRGLQKSIDVDVKR